MILDLVVYHDLAAAKILSVVIVLLLIQSNAENGTASAHASDKHAEVERFVFTGFKCIYKFLLSFISHFENHVIPSFSPPGWGVVFIINHGGVFCQHHFFNGLTSLWAFIFYWTDFISFIP